MKITDMILYKVKPRWLFLKIETDEGITGWGEPIVEGRVDTVKTAVEEYKRYLVGKDPLKIEDHWQVMYRSSFYRGGPVMMSAISGIDQALWDIKGKYHNMPIYEMLGGACHDRIKIYRWIGGDRPDELAKQAKEAISQGFNAVKTNATSELNYIDNFKKIQAVSDRLAALRDAVGFDLDVAVDFHGRVHKPMAKVLAKELDQFHLYFIEEPVLSQNNEALREVANNTSTPIATGERMFSRWDFKNILDAGYVDILQPDLSHAGGISECRKIATMAEAYDVAIAPHCPLGPIALSACIQIDTCTHNAIIQEQSLGIHYNKGRELLDYLRNPDVYKYEDGHVDLLKGPGLGIDVNEEVVIAAADEVEKENYDWKNPVWRTPDGSVAEW
jgi:galactonate dehydratase